MHFAKNTILVFLFLSALSVSAQKLKIAKLKYGGGGDWYANKTSLPNLIRFCNHQLKTNLNAEEEVVEAGSPEIFSYPFVHMTGHGNVVFSSAEAQNLRKYLMSGGFLHIDDVVVAQLVELVGRHAWHHVRGEEIENFGGQLARDAHALCALGVFDGNGHGLNYPIRS